jgi:hypothetical protein
MYPNTIVDQSSICEQCHAHDVLILYFLSSVLSLSLSRRFFILLLLLYVRSLSTFVSGFSSLVEVGLGLVVHVSGNFGIPMGKTLPLLLLNRRHDAPRRVPRRHDAPRWAMDSRFRSSKFSSATGVEPVTSFSMYSTISLYHSACSTSFAVIFPGQ